MRTTHINASPNPDGSRNVSWLCDREGWMPKGRLMAQQPDHRQQPKSLAFRLLEKRNAARQDENAVRRTMFHNT